MRSRSAFLVATVSVLAALPGPRSAEAGPDEGSRDHAAVLRGLPTARHSLLDGIRAVTTAHAVAISAQFEDGGKGLTLSVCTAGNGLVADAEHNVLQEHAGDATAAEWKPTTKVFEDRAHVGRAAEQLTLMRQTKVTLVEVILKAGTIPGATVFSATPAVRDGRGLFVVLAAVAGEVVPLTLDLMTGDPVGGAWPRTPSSPEPTPLVGTTLAEPIVGPGRWVGSPPHPLREAVGGKVVLVASNSYG